MLYLKYFCFNPFQQNTYLVYNEKGETFIIDPGNYTSSENEQLSNFISGKKLKLSRLLLTHAHIDHVLGNKYIFDNYGLLPEVHKEDLFFIDRMTQSGQMYGVNCEQSPAPIKFINDGDKINLGEYVFECLFTPGHSPGSISFYNEANKILISGDVLFAGSIGRTDLPMGNHETLLKSVREKLFVLPGDVKVYSGHGSATTIGHEKATNPFF
ncbi:MAG: MBL fold metallo-hydrolase [Bacteroidetes bacterium]|nr:MBL fold metallo-hydrolase [Bacteroidota bacterium]